MRHILGDKLFAAFCLTTLFVFDSGLALTSPLSAADAALPAESRPEASKLPEMARQAAKEFKPVSAKDVDAARESARTALRKLDRVLARNPVQVREGWNKYLQLDNLRSLLANRETQPVDVEAAVSQFTGEQAGLEWNHFVEVRKAVANYVDLATVAADGKGAETHAAALEELAKSLDEYAKSPTPELGRSLGRGLGTLRRTRQAAPLVNAVDAHYTQANLHFDASEKFLAAGIEQPVDQKAYVVDNVMGVTIRSNVRLQGDVKMSLLPSDRDGSLRLLLSGAAHSNSVGSKGPVTVYTTGVTNVAAKKDLHITDLGLLTDPASANCTTSTSINNISAKCNLIRKMAWKKASSSKGQAESIASRSAEGRIAAQLDNETLDMIEEANGSFQQKFRARLTRRGQLPRQMQFSTKSDRLSLVMLQSSDGHVAAPGPAPAVAASRDLNVRVHESFVGNITEALLGGVTLTDEKLVELLEDFSGEVPEELQIGPDKDPWSITFAGEQPITVAFTDKTLTIVINGLRFTRGDREIRDAARIAATYTIAKTPTGSKLTRQGDLEVDYVNIKGSQSVSQITFRTFLRKKFESMLKSEIASDGIKLKGRWEKAGKLAVEDIQMSAGWMALGWNLVPAADTRTAAND